MPNPKFTTAQEFKEALDGYFEKIEASDAESRKPFTVAGLALHCGVNIPTLFNTIERSAEHANALGMALLRIQEQVEIAMTRGDRNMTGLIAIMNNHFNWSNKVSTTHSFTKMPTIKVGGQALEFDVGEDVTEAE